MSWRIQVLGTVSTPTQAFELNHLGSQGNPELLLSRFLRILTKRLKEVGQGGIVSHLCLRMEPGRLPFDRLLQSSTNGQSQSERRRRVTKKRRKRARCSGSSRQQTSGRTASDATYQSSLLSEPQDAG